MITMRWLLRIGMVTVMMINILMTMYVNKRSGTQWVKGKTYDWDDNDFNHAVNKV